MQYAKSNEEALNPVFRISPVSMTAAFPRLFSRPLLLSVSIVRSCGIVFSYIFNTIPVQPRSILFPLLPYF
jgi:hypothetical protein